MRRSAGACTGVTQRILALTLRQLEREGPVLRHDFGKMPPRVEFELSVTGMELLLRMVPLWTWMVENADRFREARQKFDRRQLAILNR
ncbi:winged helix-turn-helix transcriptional regulator [Achromobacter sp. JD417]|uniref:winged helix-turn-helix transcriptional regulator n=1 Tax=Achromobacter sp. JD417 TaxID=2893881 RepID=UPI0035A6BC7F